MMIERLNSAQMLIASGEKSGDLSVRQVLSDTVAWRIQQAHSSAIVALDWSPDGTFLASGGQDGMVRVWEAWTGAAKGACSSLSPIRQIQWSPDGSSIALASSNQPIHVWNVFTCASVSS